MKNFRVDFKDVYAFSTFDKHYVSRPHDFSPFINALPQLSSLANQIKEKSKNYTFSRTILKETIAQQYKSINTYSSDIESHLSSLESPNTYTIITAHQPSLLTGPLYFVHKILSCIVTAEAANKQIPGKKILPVFIIGGEDHDFEEMNHLFYKGDKYEWVAKDPGGAVGRMSSRGIQAVIEELSTSLKKTFYGSQLLDLLLRSFDGERSAAEAMQHFLIHLFESEPILVVQMDDPAFKKAFVPHMVTEILHAQSKAPVEKTQTDLQSSLGYGNQALARDINFFYLHERKRSRIVQKGEVFEVLDTDIRFTGPEIKKHIEEYPERFSPNVIMRPIYQEFIFPNLVYIGGGGELAYWMERKNQFKTFHISFPLLVRRHSAALISDNSLERMAGFSMAWNTWFSPLHEVENLWVNKDFANELDFSDSYRGVHEAFDALRERMGCIHESLIYSTEAARVDALKPLRRLEKKMRRALKKKENTKRRQIKSVHEELYPHGALQERHSNFIEFYEKRGPALFEDLKKNFRAFVPEMVVISVPST